MLIRLLFSFAVAAIAVFALELRPVAQGAVTITFPSRLAAGPDYATDVLGDAWDMSNADDIGLDPGEIVGWGSPSTFTVSGGVAGGTTAQVNGANDSSVSFLYRGHYGLVNPGKNGLNFPINTSKYQKVAFRIYDSVGNDGPAQVYWFHNPWSDPSADSRDPTGQGMGVRFTDYTAPGWKIIVADLTQANGYVPWVDGVVRGLRIDPNLNRSGQNVSFDWIRLTANDGAGAAMQTISWSGGSGTANVDVIDSGGTVLRVATGVSGTSYNWNYGILPPGRYTLRVARGGVTGSRQFDINNPPMVKVTDPDETGGQDYATAVLGNAWDMSSPADVQATYNITNLSFNGQFNGTNTNSDPGILLLTGTNNSVPIDTSKYRYLTYTMSIDGAYNLFAGSVARVFWDSSQLFNGTTTTTSSDIIVWPNTHTYTFDLGSLSVGSGIVSSPYAQLWTAGPKRQFRFDPHEFSEPRTFHIDDIKLAAMDESKGSFTIRYSVSDADGDSTTVSLYYDTDNNASNGGMTQIVSGLTSAANGQYAWNTIAVPPGDYYVYAAASDGVQTYGRYSSGKIRILSPADPFMSIDGPVSNATLPQPFTVGGWAIDRGATSGTGVDALHIYAFPANGAAATFLGVANYYIPRTDIGNLFGTRFTNSGYSLTVRGLTPGTYTIVVYAHSTLTNSFNQSRSVVVTIPASQPGVVIDSPVRGSTIGSTFNVAGWALDRAAGSGTGVDQIHVYAWPNPGSGAAARFLGYATYGSARPDLGAVFGSQFTNSGYSLRVSGLAAGAYQISVYARSTVSGAFTEAAAIVTVVASATNPAMVVDGPASNTTQTLPFTIAGWAVDLAAASGAGVDAIHCWAYPVAGGNPVFVNVGTFGISRPDIGRVFGSQFTNSGFTLTVRAGSLSSGTYDMHVYAHSYVVNAFNQERVLRIRIP